MIYIIYRVFFHFSSVWTCADLQNKPCNMPGRDVCSSTFHHSGKVDGANLLTRLLSGWHRSVKVYEVNLGGSGELVQLLASTYRTGRPEFWSPDRHQRRSSAAHAEPVQPRFALAVARGLPDMAGD